MSIPAIQTGNSGTSIPLVVHRVRFLLKLESPVRLPRFPGSTLRGLLGHGLRKTACITLRNSCDGCRLYSRCDYVNFFESPASGETQRKRYSAMPHAWVLETEPFPQREKRGMPKSDALSFTLILVGRAVEQLALVVTAMRQAGRLGLGRGNTPFHVEKVLYEQVLGSDEWQSCEDKTGFRPDIGVGALPVLPEPAGLTTLRFLTPLRMKHEKRLLRPADFSMELFLNSLRLRIRELVAIYGLPGQECVLPVIPPGLEDAVVETCLEWRDWTRYSNRQKTSMKMGGLLGHLKLESSRLGQWWPLLWYGQWLHVGKQSSMGLGQYELVTSL